VAQVGFALAPSAWAFMAAGLLLGTGMYMIHNFIQTRVTELAPHARGSAVALHAFHFYAGQTIGPVVIGVALRRLGEAPALAMSGLALLALAFWLGRLARV
jgi:predicted MFS family arabinose efflux permease